MDDAGVLPSFKGTAVHDHWKPYFTYDGCKHALCNAHHIRELTFVEEQDHQKWAKAMKELLIAIKDAVDVAKTAGCTSLGEDAVQRFIRRYRSSFEQDVSKIPNLFRYQAGEGDRKTPRQVTLSAAFGATGEKFSPSCTTFPSRFRIIHRTRHPDAKVQQKISGPSE